MTLTKEQAEKLIDRLADKSLTFGCVFKGDGVHFTFLYSTYSAQLGNKIHGAMRDFPISIASFSAGEFEVLGHPIMIGDVLEKIEKAKFTTKDLERIFPKALSDSQKKKGVTLHHVNLYIEINNLWRNCGFTKSLQEILETIEWECKCVLRHADHDEKCFPWIAKPSPATELFEFLVSLFPINHTL